MRKQPLQRHHALEPRWAALAREKHLAHAASSERREDLVFPKRGRHLWSSLAHDIVAHMLSVLVWALATGGPPPDAGATNAPAIETLEMGIEAYRRGDFDAAVRNLTQAAISLEKDAPHAARAHLNLG